MNLSTVLGCCCIFFSATVAAQPGEGECSSEFFTDFSRVQKCSPDGKCTSRTSTTITVATVLSCEAPLGLIFKVGFKDRSIEGTATEQIMSNGDRIYFAELKNPKNLGGYPKKFVIVMSSSPNKFFANQVVILGSGSAPYTELLFGKRDSASRQTGKNR